MVAIIVVSSLISLSRGFVKEALSLLTWIVAGAVAWMFGGALAQHLGEYIQTPSARIIAACALLFIATLLLGALVNSLIGELIRVTGLSGTDRFLGMVFGGARGVLLVVLLVGLLSLAPVQQDPWWQQSVLMPHFLMVADWSKNFILGFAGQWLPAAPITPPSGIGALRTGDVVLFRCEGRHILHRIVGIETGVRCEGNRPVCAPAAGNAPSPAASAENPAERDSAAGTLRFTLSGDGNYRTTEHCLGKDIVAVMTAVILPSGRIVRTSSRRWKRRSRRWLALPRGVRRFVLRVMWRLGIR